MKTEKNIKIMLAGNPNCGKTTLFNILTGSNQRTGNRAGVTVEKKYGYVKNSLNKKIILTDLPGIYSLYPYSPEEKTAVNSLLNDEPDVIINIVDSTNLERNLYLTTQLKQLDIPIIVALNMYDVLMKSGNSIDTIILEKNYNVPFIPVSAIKNTGTDKLISKALQTAENRTTNKILKIFSPETNDEIEKIEKNLSKRNSYFRAVSIFEEAKPQNHKLVAEQRYKFIQRVTEKAFKHGNTEKTKRFSNKADKIITSRIFSIPIFILIMSAIFYITFGPLGQSMKSCTEYIINNVFENHVKNMLIFSNTSQWAQSLLIDGLIAGVGSVISFLPQIALIFSLLSILEDSGYMSRAIFITDKILRNFGLSGKSIIPVIMGFGCTVPAILSTRTLENQNEKNLAILITPFMSCSAKMPVYLMFTSAFFSKHSALVVLFLYLFGITVAILTSLIFKDDRNEKCKAFILEIPPYHLPSLKSVFIHTIERVKDFLYRAGTVLLGASVIIWFLQGFDINFHPVSNSESILAQIGRFIAPIFSLCGFDSWQASVSLLTGIAAKEGVASTLSVLHSQTGLHNTFNTISALSFLVFVLLYPPCIASISTVYKETKSLKQTALSVIYQLFVAWLSSALVYQIGSLIINIRGVL